MLFKGCAAVALFAALNVVPAAAFAQQMPPATDGTSVNEPPAAGAAAAFDACGNSPQTAFGNTDQQGAPVSVNYADPKDTATAQQRQNVSSVDGFVVHTAGNLVLVSIPSEPAAGTGTATTPDKTMAVIRLPGDCTVNFDNGTHVQATGIPTTDGILNAEMVQVGG